MRIYKIKIEHKSYGTGFDSRNIAARTFKEAIRKVNKYLRSQERIESVILLEEAD